MQIVLNIQKKHVYILASILILVGLVAAVDIYYTDGWVGIGTDTPAEMLHVQDGNIYLNHTDNWLNDPTQGMIRLPGKYYRPLDCTGDAHLGWMYYKRDNPSSPSDGGRTSLCFCDRVDGGATMWINLTGNADCNVNSPW